MELSTATMENSLDRLRQRLRGWVEGTAPASEWEWLAEGGGLRLGLQEAVERAGEDDPTAALDECWELLTRADDPGRPALARRRIGRYFAGHSAGVEVDVERLYGNALGLVATAQAAAAARQALSHGDAIPRLIDSWRRAAEALAGSQTPASEPPPAVEGSWLEAEENGSRWVVEAVARDLRGRVGWPLEQLRLWTTFWLGEEPEGTAELRLPIVGVAPGGAFLAELRLAEQVGATETQEGEGLTERPESALQAFDRLLPTTIEQAWRQRYGRAVSWSVTTAGLLKTDALGGDSLGLAATVGFALLKAKRPYDASCLLTARVTDDGERVGRVAHERDKLNGLLKQRGKSAIRRVGVAHDTALTADFREAMTEAGLEVRRLATVAEALDYASGLVTGLLRYLERLIERPDERPLPAYLGEHRPTALYVEPDVLIREKRKEGQSERDGYRPPVSAAALEIGEDSLYGLKPDEVERRGPWRKAREKLERGELRCGAVLGPPGQGKTELVKMTARALALEAREQLTSRQADPDALTIPIALTFRELTERVVGEGETAEEALRRTISEQLDKQSCAGETRRYLVEGLGERRTWLFLDAFDELPAERQEIWDDYVRVLSRWRCRVVLTSRPYAYEARRLPYRKEEIGEYRLAPLSGEQRETFIERWYGEKDRGESILELQRSNPAVEQTAQNPFLLLPLLAEVSLALFEQTSGRQAFAVGPLLERLGASERRPVPQGVEAKELLRLTPPQQAGFLLEELREKRLLVPVDEEKRAYVFPHRSFGEYLAACGIAQMLADQTTDEETKERHWNLADRKAWDPDWEQVIVFLAGKLAERPEELEMLLGLLSDDKKDDDFRHRLAVAALCLGQVQREQSETHQQSIDRITTDTMSLWWCHRLKNTHAVVEHLELTLPTLARINGRWKDAPLLSRTRALLTGPRFGFVNSFLMGFHRAFHGQPIIGRIAHFMRARIAERQKAALHAIEQMGAPAATESILERVVELMENPNFGVQKSAARALAELGLAAATSAVLTRLTQLLASGDAAMMRCAADAIRPDGLGKAAATKPTLDRLAELLAYSELRVRESAAYAIGKFGDAAATEEILERIAHLLGNEDSTLRKSAEMALANLGTAAASEPMLRRLSALLSHQDESVAASVASAIGTANLGEAGATELILDRLAELLADRRKAVKPKAMWAIGGLDKAGAVPAVLQRLEGLMADEDWMVRWAAADVVGKLGPAAATEPILRGLAVLLADQKDEVQWAAAESIQDLGEAAANPYILQHLIALMGSMNESVRSAAAEAIGWSWTAATAKPLVRRVADLLDDPFEEVRTSAAMALVRFGALATTEPLVLGSILEWIEDSLEGEDVHEVFVAAQTIEELGAIAATASVLGQLSALLADHSAVRRSIAVSAISKFGSAAATEPILRKIVLLLSDRDSAVRQAAVEAIGTLWAAEAAPTCPSRLIRVIVEGRLILLVADRDSQVREAAVEAIGRIATRTTVLSLCRLVPLMDAMDAELRGDAAKAIRHLHGVGIRSFRRHRSIQCVQQLASIV